MIVNVIYNWLLFNTKKLFKWFTKCYKLVEMLEKVTNLLDLIEASEYKTQNQIHFKNEFGQAKLGLLKLLRSLEGGTRS